MPGLPSAGALERELDQHLNSVQDLYERVIHSQLPRFYAGARAGTGGPAEPTVHSKTSRRRCASRPSAPNFPPPICAAIWISARPRFAQLIAGGGIERSQESFESFLEKIVAAPGWLDMLEHDAELARCTIDVFEHSQYFADQLVRQPELLEEVRRGLRERQGRTGFRAPREPDASAPLSSASRWCASRATACITARRSSKR